MHPVHITMTSIDYVQGTDSLKVFCKMGFDDFLKDLQTIDDDRNLYRLFSKQPFPSDLINQYFNSKVFIYVNNKLLIGKLLSANITDTDINLNLNYRLSKKPKSITIRNLIRTIPKKAVITAVTPASATVFQVAWKNCGSRKMPGAPSA